MAGVGLVTMATRGIEVLIPAEKMKHSQWYLDLKGRMRCKLRTKRGRARYKLRQEAVEPVVGPASPWSWSLQQR